MTEALREALPAMGRKLKGFDRADAVLTAVESRSSSPIRILRDKTGMSLCKQGIYPAGEGAGYAGGIVSAAVDGIFVAEKLQKIWLDEIKKYHIHVCECGIFCFGSKARFRRKFLIPRLQSHKSRCAYPRYSRRLQRRLHSDR